MVDGCFVVMEANTGTFFAVCRLQRNDAEVHSTCACQSRLLESYDRHINVLFKRTRTTKSFSSDKVSLFDRE